MYRIVKVCLILILILSSCNNENKELVCTQIGCGSTVAVKYSKEITESYNVTIYKEQDDVEQFQCKKFDSLYWDIINILGASILNCNGNQLVFRHITPILIEIIISSIENNWEYKHSFTPSYQKSYPNGYECDKDNPCLFTEIKFEIP